MVDLSHLLLYWGSPLEFLAVLVLALLLDQLYPFHRGILFRIHPVHTSYMLALRLHRPHSSRAWGLVVVFIVMGSHMLAYACLLVASGIVWEPLHILAGAWVLKVSIGNRLLVDTVSRVGSLLERGEIGEARALVQGIVRRDTSRLEKDHVSSAAIESLAESLVDGVASPLFYYALLGPLGALFQRIANTLDGALGFKTPEFREEGWSPARLDTLLNYLPARLVAVLAVLLCNNPKRGRLLECTVENAGLTESVNAGYPMSAFACCLRVSLEKTGAYHLGKGPLPSVLDVSRAVLLYKRVLVTLLLAFVLVGVMVRTSISWEWWG